MQVNWDESIDYTPEQQVEREKMILSQYEVDPKYFIEKDNIPIIGKKEVAPALPKPGEGEEEDEEGKKPTGKKPTKKQKLVKPFFD